MTDHEKLGLVSKMISDFWACSNVSEDSAICLLNCVTCVIEFEGEEAKNAED